MTTVTQDPNDALLMTTVTTDSSSVSVGSESTMSSTATQPAATNTVTAEPSTSSSNTETTAGSNQASSPISGILAALSSTTAPNQLSMTSTTNTTLIFCPEPSSIVGGSTVSSGPYVANVSSAEFSCYAGYSLNGAAKVMCSAAGVWASSFPQCIPINNRPKVDNQLTFNQEYGAVPLWLLVVLAVAVGLLCLLMLTCLLLYCLKLFGCWKGGGLGSKLGSARRVHNTEIFHDDFGRTDAYRQKRVSYNHNDVERQSRPNRCSDFGTQTRRISEETSTSSTTVRGWDVRKYRREAKMPAKLTWMPHSNNVRHYNTSTK